MLTMIFEWLSQGLGEALDLVVGIMLNALDLDISYYVDAFPALGIGYQIFQGVGLGLIIVLGGLAILRFFKPSLFGNEQSNDTLFGILFNVFVAGAALYMGNYVLSFIVDIAKVPYDIFASTDFVDLSLLPTFSGIGKSILQDFVMSGSDIAMTLISFIVICLIAWNMFKLILEVFERYMMVGILVYTSPLFFAMIANGNTRQSFRKWMSMFVGSCAMMTVSAFFLKLVCSGFSFMGEGSENFVIRLLLILAVCKIAQRADTYMQQLGINVGTTGQNMLDDFFVAGKAIGSVFGGGGRSTSGGNKNSVLDPNAQRSRLTGIDSIAKGTRAGIESFREGNSLRNSAKVGVSEAAANMKNTNPTVAAGRAAKEAINSGKSGAEVAKSATSAYVSQFKDNVGQAIAPETYEAHKQAKTQQARMETVAKDTDDLRANLQRADAEYQENVNKNTDAAKAEYEALDSNTAERIRGVESNYTDKLNDNIAAESAAVQQINDSCDKDIANNEQAMHDRLESMGLRNAGINDAGVAYSIDDNGKTITYDADSNEAKTIQGAYSQAEEYASNRRQQAEQDITSTQAQYASQREVFAGERNSAISTINDDAAQARSTLDRKWKEIENTTAQKHQETAAKLQSQIAENEEFMRKNNIPFTDSALGTNTSASSTQKVDIKYESASNTATTVQKNEGAVFYPTASEKFSGSMRGLPIKGKAARTSQGQDGASGSPEKKQKTNRKKGENE